MTRDQAHRIPPVPSNATKRALEAARRGDLRPEHIRDMALDPGYDQPGPPRRSDLSWQSIIELVVLMAGIIVIVGLCSLVAVE